MHIELLDPLPCPSCGSTDVYCEQPYKRPDLRYVVCFQCKKEGPIVPHIFGEEVPNIKAENRAIEAWNQMVKKELKKEK